MADWTSANTAGKRARKHTRSAAIATATGVAIPPYCAMTPLVQYTVPAKYTTPVISPATNAFERRVAWRLTSERCTSSGVSASHATTGWPYLGKLSASRMPDSRGRRNGDKPAATRVCATASPME
jgi:hypothetical protein